MIIGGKMKKKRMTKMFSIRVSNAEYNAVQEMKQSGIKVSKNLRDLIQELYKKYKFEN